MQTSQAKKLTFEHRKNIALEVISNNNTITQLSKQYQTSRKFINQQKAKAINAINFTFATKHGSSIVILACN